jgi:hypothetical protein
MERRKAIVVAGAVTLSAFAGASALGAATGLLGFGGAGTAEPAPSAASAPGVETRIVHLPGRVTSTTTPPQSPGRTPAAVPSSGPIAIPASASTPVPVLVSTPPPVPGPTSAADSGPAPVVSVPAPSAPSPVVVTPSIPVPVSGASPRTGTPRESDGHEAEHDSPTQDAEHAPEAEQPDAPESGD